MQNYRVELESKPSISFYCKKAADSLDIDVRKKLKHSLKVSADLESPYNVGLILGSSGSGKTTLAQEIFGIDCFKYSPDMSKPVIDQFPEDMEYADRAKLLLSVGLSSVPCWIRPMFTLSNGQTARAEAALRMANSGDFVIDEWTSTVDRTVAKAMSICLNKFARKNDSRITVISCHYDIVEWLEPDWIIDCNKQIYENRRSLRCSRKEKLQFDIRPCGRESWRYFSKYHYLSDRLPGGHIETYGLFHLQDQIGFQCFANYTPDRAGHKRMMHSNRTVIHPDYVGFGLGVRLINITSADMTAKGFDVRAKFSSEPVKKSFDRHPDKWRCQKIQRDTPKSGVNMDRKTGFRQHVKTFSYVWIGGSDISAISMQAM